MTNEHDETPFDDDYGDGTDTLAAFTAAGKPKLEVVDRSTLEAWSICPFRGKAVESGAVTIASRPIEIGNQCHAAISDSITEYVESDRLDISPSEFADGLQRRVFESRPDVQSEVVESMRWAIWKITNLIMGSYTSHCINPSNILRYDGGRGDKSGQLAMDIAGVRFTSELDFLYSASKTVLHEKDWKTGRTHYDTTKIRHSFQFQSHALLALHHYHMADTLEIEVLNTRTGWSGPVEFRRSDLPAITALIRSAIEIRAKWKDVPLAEVEAQPYPEKCSICPALKLCPRARPTDVAADPVKALGNFVVVSALYDKLKDEMTEHIDATGEPIIADGYIFDRNKPAERRPNATLHLIDGAPPKSKKATSPKPSKEKPK